MAKQRSLLDLIHEGAPAEAAEPQRSLLDLIHEDAAKPPPPVSTAEPGSLLALIHQDRGAIPPPEDPGFWSMKYAGAPLRGLGWLVQTPPARALGWGLDLLRRGAHAGAYATGEAAASLVLGEAPDPLRALQEGWAFAAPGEELTRMGVTQKGAGFLRETLPNIAWDISVDPLNLFLVGSLTKGGQLVKMGTQQSYEAAVKLGMQGGLGRTWAAQAKMGQRALLQIITPSGRRTLIQAPRAVAGLARTGRGLARPFWWLRSRSANPTVRAIQEIATSQHANEAADLLKYKDEIARMNLELHPRQWEQVQIAAEYAGRDAQRFGQFPPQVQQWAQELNLLNSARNEVAERAGLTVATPDKRFTRALEDIREASGRELSGLRRQVQGGLHDLAAKEKRWVDDAARLKIVEEEAVGETFRVAGELQRAEDVLGMTSAEAGRALPSAKKSRNLIRGLREEYAEVRHAARNAHSDSVRKMTQALRAGDEAKALRQGWVPDSPVLRNLDAQVKKIDDAMAKMPNAVPRVLTREARITVMEELGKHKGPMGRVWSDEFSGNLNRGFTETIFYKGEKVGGKVLREPLERFRSLDEIKELAKAPEIGAKIERYARVTRMGLTDRLRFMFGRAIRGTKQVELSRFYEMNPVKAFNDTTDGIIHAIRGTDFIQAMAREPDVFSDIARAGWHKVSDVDPHLVESLSKIGVQGERWLHPDLVTEITRTLSNGMSRGVGSAMGQVHDALLRTFKGAVTVPERVAGRGIEFVGEQLARAGLPRVGGAVADVGKAVEIVPWWVAYHFRNGVSDFMLMAYNGLYNPLGVLKNGTRAVRGKAGKFIDFGLPGLHKVPAAEAMRMAQARSVTFGIQSATVGGSAIGEFLENSRRVGYWIDRMRAGFSPNAAALECRRVLFDYTALSNFERHTMRRIIPFWSWKRNIVKLNVEQAFHRPATIAAQLRFRADIEPDVEAPEWLRGRMSIALDPDKQTGEERFLTGIDFPIEDTMEALDFSGGFKPWVKQMAFGFNPLMKLGLATGTDVLPIRGGGIDVDRMRQFKAPVRVPNTVAAIARKTGIGSLVNLRQKKYRGQTYYTMDPYWEYFLRTVMARFYSTARAWEREDRTPAEKMLRHGTGWGVYRVDQRRERQMRQRRERQQNIEDATRRGDVRIHEVPFRPRGSELTPGAVRRLR